MPRSAEPKESVFSSGSAPSSCASSRSSSPARAPSSPTESQSSCEAVGTGPDEYYIQILHPWRAALRKFVMRHLDAESAWIARVQHRFRSPALDKYFLYSSALGSHTCFMLFLPALYFFGYAQLADALVTILTFGVYFTSFLKDLACSPRPYAPPVERLTIGNHHLEYGFPSTHSTNSVSIALYIFARIHESYISESNIVSTFSYVTSMVLLVCYALTIVLGRLYTGMHSITDVTAGSLLGATIWAGHAYLWLPIEGWLVGSPDSALHSLLPSWTGPLVTVIALAVLVHRHPQPVEDCPCWEDAIAVLSVLGGILLARFAAFPLGVGLDSRMPGSPFAPFSEGLDVGISEAWFDALLWWATAALKLTVGIAIIFAWRLAVKFLLHSLLPPFFRFLARDIVPKLVSIKVLPQGTGMPNRRFYTPATEYRGAVPTIDEDGLRSIPSVMDLPAMLSSATEERRSGGNTRWDDEREIGSEGLKKRSKGRKRSEGSMSVSPGISPAEKRPFDETLPSPKQQRFETHDEDDDGVKHYDADVLTKVIVYAGIGILACGLIPFMFDVLGWGVRI